MTFDEIAMPGKCDICGAEGPVVVCCSTMGAVSYAYCKHCYDNELEPYGAMVAYISCAGHYPEDINDTYIDIVRHNLEFYGKTEEEFTADVDRLIREEEEFFRKMLDDDCTGGEFL